MTSQRRFRLIIFLLFVSVTFLTVNGQDAPLNGFNDCVNKRLPGMGPGMGPGLVLLPK